MAVPERTDILICGAGPSGLALAVALAHRGIPFLLCDRLAEGQNTSRAAVVHARTLERLEMLGVAETLVAQGNPVPVFTMRERDEVLLRLDFSGLPTAYPYALILPQNRTEAALRQRLRELGGAIHWRHAVESVAVKGEGAEVVLRDEAETLATVSARFVVAADGFHSTVREAAGIPFRTGTYAQSFVLADVRGPWPLGAQEVQLFLGERGLMVAAPFAADHLRLVATCDEAEPHPPLDLFRAILAERGPAGARLDALVWSSRFRVHHGVAARYRAGPLFLVGDAAHVHSPAGGQGMNTGIQDAIRLGALLADVLRDGADPASLDRYEAERRPVAEGVVAMTDRMTRLAALRGGLPRAARNLVLRGVGRLPALRRVIATRIAELDV